MKSLVLVFCLFGSAGAWAQSQGRFIQTAFVMNWSRYPAPDELFTSFRNHFGDFAAANVKSDCSRLTDKNRAVLGDSSAISGRTASDNPNEAFVNWYTDCLTAYINLQSTGLLTNEAFPLPPHLSNDQIAASRAELAAAFSSSVLDDCAKSQNPKSLVALNGVVSSFTCHWTDLSPGTKLALARANIEKLVGPEEIVQLNGLANSEDEYAQSLVDAVDAFNEKPDDSLKVMIGTPTVHLLTVIQAAKTMKMLIGLQDTFQY